MNGAGRASRATLGLHTCVGQFASVRLGLILVLLVPGAEIVAGLHVVPARKTARSIATLAASKLIKTAPIHLVGAP